MRARDPLTHHRIGVEPRLGSASGPPDREALRLEAELVALDVDERDRTRATAIRSGEGGTELEEAVECVVTARARQRCEMQVEALCPASASVEGRSR